MPDIDPLNSRSPGRKLGVFGLLSMGFAIMGVLALASAFPPGFHKPRLYRLVAGLSFDSSIVIGVIGFIVNLGRIGRGISVLRIGTLPAILISICGLLLLWEASHQCIGRVPCASNLRQIGQGLLLYAGDHNGRLPNDLDELIRAAELSPNVLHCPGTVEDPIEPGKGPRPVYLGSGHLERDFSADDIIAYCYSKENHDGANVLFGDGHIDWYSDRQFPQLLAENDARRSTTRPASQTRPTTSGI